MPLLSVVLAGDTGSRLWPVSRRASPTPFMSIGGATLLQRAVERGQASGSTDLLMVTHQDHQFLAKDVLQSMVAPSRASMLLEPAGCDTAAEVALAALHCTQTLGGGTVMLVLPADQLIPDVAAFATAAKSAVTLAAQGMLVLFGVSPTGPDTGFDYVEVAQMSQDSQPAIRFVEKPDLPTAQGFVATGRHFWNSGIYCFTADAIVSAFEKWAPDALAAARLAIDSATTKGDALAFDRTSFEQQPQGSLETAVMKRADNVHVVAARFGWSDVGSWPSVAQAHTSDADGNTMPADALAYGTSGTHVQVESHRPKVVAALGLRDLVIVDTPDALLVAHKDSAHDVDKIVAELRQRKHETIDLPATVNRPWGTYASLKEEDGYKVKRITVKPGQSLSLQYHHQRAEHWVVVRGTAIVQVGDVEYKTLPGEYRYIPLQERHRLTNIGSDELVLIEVQCGGYLGEDDIVRLADTYGRA